MTDRWFAHEGYPDGRQVLVLSFEAKVLDAAGQEKLIQILFDPAGLEQRVLAKNDE